MKKCIIIPDSFKGTMSALEFCQIAEKTVKRHMPGCEVLTIPVADGGEGTVDCFVCAPDVRICWSDGCLFTGPIPGLLRSTHPGAPANRANRKPEYCDHPARGAGSGCSGL